MSAELAPRATEPTVQVPRRDGLEQAGPMAAQAGAAERLLEDETLRGGLADDEFQPLLDWALEASDGLVARAAVQADAEAGAVIEAGLGQLREIVRTAARAITATLEEGPAARDMELRELTAMVGPPLVPSAGVESSRMTLMAALDRVAEDRSLAGADLAGALAEALGRATADTGETAGDRHATA